MIETVGSALIVLFAVLGNACALVYGLGFRWWRSGYGRHMLAFMGALAVIIDVWVARLLLGEWSWYPELRLAAFALLPIVTGWRLAILLRALPAELRERRAERAHRPRP
ncbi:putative phage holin [Herbidospora sp. RD11066]